MSVAIRFKMLEGCDDLAPAKAHSDDAAYDLRSRIDLTIDPGKVALVPTGLTLELPVGYEAQVRPRSGLALKSGIGVCVIFRYCKACCSSFNGGDLLSILNNGGKRF